MPAAPAATPEPPPGSALRWRVRLLGTLQADGAAVLLQRWPSRAVGLLLARLALAPQRAHAREELIELLWPGAAPAVGRNRLRQALSTLKSLLEGPGAAPVLLADRLTVRVVPGALTCDALQFEALLREGRQADAVALYRGPLMPGHYDEWVHGERERLAALHDALLARPTQVPAAPAARAGAPPLRPGAPATGLPVPARHALPHYLTRWFGPDDAVQAVVDALGRHRLVSLLGPGGSGKTRLAVEAARRLVGRGDAPPFERLLFVPLADCRSAQALREALARALELHPDSADDDARLAEPLAGQRLLLVLDNLEQLDDEATGPLAQLLARLEGLHVLATSRRALELDGEHRIDTQPLGLPGPHDGVAEAAAMPAVALFLDRARAVRADFRLHEGNGAAVVALVRALQGLPLAIELAASRVRSFAPAQMLEMWRQAGGPLALLARPGRRAGAAARHASMTAAIDWSWQLLPAPGRQALSALALFSGDAGVPGLAAMLQQPAAGVAALLDELVGHSLVQPVPGDEAARFALAEPVRAFVREYTPAPQAAVLRRALVDWLVAWAAGLGPAPSAADVAPEWATVQSVLADAAELGPPALALALALRCRFETTGLPRAVQQALEQALPAAAGQPALASAAHELLAWLRFEAGFVDEARAHAQAALALAPALAPGGGALRARALVRCVWVELAAGRDGDADGARPLPLAAMLEEALALAEAAADADAQARALHQQAVLVWRRQQDWQACEALLARSQALWEGLGDRGKALARLRSRGQCWLKLGRVAQARECFEQCERAAAADGDWVGQIDSLLSLSTLLASQRQWGEALQADRRCVALCWLHWHRHGLAYALWNVPLSLARLRRPAPALQLTAFAAGFWESRFGRLGNADRRGVQRVRRLAGVQLGAARTELLWSQGAAMPLREAVALALSA